MQLKSLRLGAIVLACAVLVAVALPAPHTSAQAADDPSISSVNEAERFRIDDAILDLIWHIGEAREREVRALRSSRTSSATRAYLDTRIAWIEEIERGDPRVMYETALRLRDGNGLPQHRLAALTWLERAGDHGVPEGYYALARMRLDSPDGEGDLLIGGMTLKRAAYMGVTAAQKDLGLREIAGVPLDGSYYQGYAWLLLARANGVEVDDDVLANAGEHLTEEERQDARRSVRKAAGKARLPRIWPLRDDFRTSEIWQAEVRSALNWQECGRALAVLDGARQSGDAEAEHELAVLYEEGTCVALDAANALKHYTVAVDRGHMRSAFRLGLLYHDGRGVAQDLTAARFWFKAAALSLVLYAGSGDERHAELMESARRRLQVDPFRYRELPPELVTEIDWLTEIEDGDPRILYETALRVRDGRGLPRVRRAAEAWLSRAGKRGVAKAYYDLGLTRINDPVHPRDEEAGIISLARAGRDGFVPAQVEMGRRYAAGDQVRRWDLAAYVWLLIAEENGADVAALLEDIAARLSDGDRQTAREEAEKGTYYPLRSR